MTLDFFRLHTIYDLPGASRALCWERLILLATDKEPSITHAAIALAAMNRAQASLPPSTVMSESATALACLDMKQHSFALAQYSKAMVHLHTYIAALPDKATDEGIETVLLLTLLFFCFNILQQDDAGAISHVAMGLRILRANLPADDQYQSKTSIGEKVIPVKLRPRTGLDVLAHVFVRLDGDSTLATPDDQFLRAVCSEPIPRSFSSLDEAMVRATTTPKCRLHQLTN